MEKIAKRLAWGLWLFTLASVAAGIVLAILNRGTLSADPITLYSILILSALSFATVGALIARRHPRNAIGWLFCAIGLFFGGVVLSEEYAVHGFAVAPGSLPAADLVGYATVWLFPIGPALIPLVFLLFPSGRAKSRAWGAVVWVAVILLVLTLLAAVINPATTTGTNDRFLRNGFTIENPLGIESVGDLTGAVLAICAVGLLAIGLASVVALFLRLRTTRGEERQQLRWLAYMGVAGVCLLPLFPLAFAFGDNEVIGSIFWFGVTLIICLGIPLASGIAIMRYRLFDLDIVVKKTVVFGALLGFGVIVYLAVVVGIGAEVGSRGDSALTLAAAAIVALAFQPLRAWARRLADRLVYGKRATPYEVLADFSDRMSAAYSIEAVLPRMAQTIAEATGASEAEVWLRVGSELRPAASWPDGDGARSPVRELEAIPDVDGTFPVIHQEDLLGALTVSMPPSEPLTPSQEKLLRDLAAQAGLVLRNVRLVEEVRASRQRLVTAQDERAKALERNLHDGAQQQLVALAVRLRLARSSAQKEGARSTVDLLDGLATDANDALENLRDLARGIYPPLLADKGLASALEAQTRRGTIPVDMHHEGVGRYPPDVESALYFCCLEALQNVAKYAHATHAEVRLSATGDELAFEVVDDGDGFDPKTMPLGSGLQGMADRLEALGGTLEVRSEPGAGTTVAGRIAARAIEPIP
jgi:signal transduction histidine kinase